MNTKNKLQTQFLFFSGKGGVGKTTTSCATAVHYAHSGKKTLIITTDPASNLADVFKQNIGHKITSIKAVENLFAMELDPNMATQEYKNKTLLPLQGLIPDESFEVLEEQLNSPCTAEMASFDRFTDFVQEGDFEMIIFDTAPTGHTLRLLELPVEWSGVIEKAAQDGSSGQTCIGPAAALAESKEKFDRAISAMRDAKRTTFIFVVRPESTPIYEAKRSIEELAQLGIHSQEIIINGVYPKAACDNSFMKARYQKQQEFIKTIATTFTVPTRIVELSAEEINGVKGLENIATKLCKSPLYIQNFKFEAKSNEKNNSAPQSDRLVYGSPSAQITQLLTPAKNNKRLIFFAGKGGVGKTSISAATALWTNKMGYKTLLLTTDPASHLQNIFEQPVGSTPTRVIGEENLYVAHVDAAQATEEYKEKILAEARLQYDASRLQAIEEELDSPCTEEMATFEKFIDFVTIKDFEVIVFDTAPTGHTLRLLELPVDWNKQLEIKTLTNTSQSEGDSQAQQRFQETISLLQDPQSTTFSFVMYPESTPIEEASRAVDELATIKVPTSLIIANQVLDSHIVTNEYLSKRSAMQQKYLKTMTERFNAPIVKLPLLQEDLIGKDKLMEAGYLLYGKEL